MSFSDHFSEVSASYARYRPRYPRELFAFLQSVVRRHELAWDCATGTGQAAAALAEFFDEVVATDASPEQIVQARMLQEQVAAEQRHQATTARPAAHARVRYAVTPAERTDLPDSSIDLITVAQALHWFDLDGFYAEATRVLASNGVVAAWCYENFEVDHPAVQEAVDFLYGDVIGPYWPPERRMVEDGYRSLHFPFEEIRAPEFEVRARLSVAEIEGYLRTWSATQRYARAEGRDPVAALQLGGITTTPIGVRWPLSLRIGRRRDHRIASMHSSKSEEK